MKIVPIITAKKKRKKAKSPFEVLKENKIPLTEEERQECLDSKATWNFAPTGKPCPAVWKGKDSKGKLWYVTNTHRAWQKAPSLKGAIRKYHDFIKGTAGITNVWTRAAQDGSDGFEEGSPDESGGYPEHGYQSREDVPEEHRNGDCYEAAGRYVMDHSLSGDRGLVLVHGLAIGQGTISGVQFGHAWVEDGEDVLDVANGKELRVPKPLYYAIGGVSGTYKYTWEEMRKKMLEHRHWGPWDYESEF